jgi:hypothetical protein
MTVKYGESIEFCLVDISAITPESDRSSFYEIFFESEIEKLAKQILSTGCLLKPLILKQTSPMQYKVIEGDFEYYAAVLANERDTQRVLGGMVSAFVVKPEIEEVAVTQATSWGKCSYICHDECVIS